MNYIHYYADFENNDPPYLSRIIEDRNGVRGGNYINGDWLNDPRVVRLAMDSQWAEKISAQEAEKIIKQINNKNGLSNNSST
jgi:hypothetical protein